MLPDRHNNNPIQASPVQSNPIQLCKLLAIKTIEIFLLFGGRHHPSQPFAIFYPRSRPPTGHCHHIAPSFNYMIIFMLFTPWFMSSVVIYYKHKLMIVELVVKEARAATGPEEYHHKLTECTERCSFPHRNNKIQWNII